MKSLFKLSIIAFLSTASVFADAGVIFDGNLLIVDLDG